MEDQNESQAGEADPRDDTPDPESADGEQRELRRRHAQVLTPLFVLAFGLMALGYYLGITDEVDLSAPEQAKIDLVEGRELGDAAEAEQTRARLRYSAFDERRYSLQMRQRSTRRFLRGESEPLETRIALEVSESSSMNEASGNVEFDRRYEAARVEVDSAGAPVGRDITSQVEALLAGIHMQTVLQPNGQPVDFEWREVSNPQVRRGLLLIRDAHRFTTPRFRRDEVNIGETWVYTIEISVENIDRGLVVRGGVDVANRLAALERRDGRLVAVVEQEFSADARGEAQLPGGGVAPFVLEGSGRGMQRFDVDGGYVLSSDIEVERVLSVEQGDGQIDQTSTVAIELRPIDAD